MSISWIVQNNLGSTSSTAESIKYACEQEGQTFVPIQVVPFSHDLPDFPEIEGKFVLYGRTTLMLNAYHHPLWQKGLYFEPDLFTPKCYLEHWGELMLNHDAIFTVLSQSVNAVKDKFKSIQRDDMLFVRPNDDLKYFAGGMMPFSRLIDMMENSLDGEPVNPNTELVISLPKNIDREWRLFVVDGKVVTGSQYLPSASAFVPQGVIDFAEKVVSTWSPVSIFVIDIASASNNFKIIECNCFNGSGFYHSDLNKLVRMVSKYIEFT